MLQLSDNDPKKQGLVISVANNLMKFYDPDKVAVEIVTFGPGIELLRPENPNRKLVESLVAQGARVDICLNTVDTLERDTGKRPEFIQAATPVQVGVAQILLLTEVLKKTPMLWLGLPLEHLRNNIWFFYPLPCGGISGFGCGVPRMPGGHHNPHARQAVVS